MANTRRNYYRATFRRTVNPDAHWQERRFEFSDLVFEAANYTEARDHAQHHASVIGQVYCTVQRLDRLEGQRLIDAEKLLQRIRAI